MRRVQAQFSEVQTRSLRELARAEERPVAALIREAIDSWVVDRERKARLEGAVSAISHAPSRLRESAETDHRFIDAGDLVGISEICSRAGRSSNTIQSWRRRYRTFPKPVAQLAAGPIWDWGAVARWLSARSAGRIRRSATVDVGFSALPGVELVVSGLDDLNAGRESAAGTLLRSAATRLEAVGISVPGGAQDDATSRLYALLVEQVGEGRAHGRYNALRRRLSSFLHAAAAIRAQATTSTGEPMPDWVAEVRNQRNRH